MYLYPFDRKLLALLKKVQVHEGAYVVLLTDNTCFQLSKLDPACEDVDCETHTHYPLPAPLFSTTLQNSLNILIEEGLIKRAIMGEFYQVTARGWRNLNIQKHELLKAIVTHVAFPSLVAFITALLTLTKYLWLNN